MPLIMYNWAVLFLCLLSSTHGQKTGTSIPEISPALTIQKCNGGSCVNEAVSLTLDASWRSTHGVGISTSCYNINTDTWNPSLCPDGKTCAQGCAVEGADYAGTYGIATSGNAVTLQFITQSVTGTNVGSRVFVKSSLSAYQLFKTKNQEFAFGIDLSNVPCGVGANIYFVQMDADGGLSTYPTNKAGARFGTGYCDASCPHNVKWINGRVSSRSPIAQDCVPERISLRRPIY
jgi:cellulose 1,4-beta-cellobiosidase